MSDAFLNEWLGRVYPGDCLRLLADLPDCSVDMVMCDWPYRGAPDRPAITDDLLLAEACRVTKPTGSIVLWDYDVGIVPAWGDLERAGWQPERLCPWVYRNGRLGGRGMRRCVEFAVWAHKGNPQFNPGGFGEAFDSDAYSRPGGLTYRRDGRLTYRDSAFAQPRDWCEHPAQTGAFSREARERVHPQQKPETVMQRWVLGLTEESDIVLDLFCGSGTVPTVCERYGRQWLAAEINPTYVAIAEKRIAAERAKGKLELVL